MPTYDALPWAPFRERFATEWKQGEHVAAVSPTGGGKTTLFADILTIRAYVVVLASKRADSVLSNKYPGYKVARDWPIPSHVDRALLWPRKGKTIDQFKSIQRDVFARAIDGMFFQRGWTVAVDELHYLSDKESGLGIPGGIVMAMHQGRSSNITVVAGMQRPSWVPPVIFSGSTHAFLWKTTHPEDLKRISALGGVNIKELAANLGRLPKHDFIYVNTRDGSDPVRSRVAIGGR